MPGIKGVKFTDLFWETLEPHRKHPNYRFIREKLRDFMLKKAENFGPCSTRDKPFLASCPQLAGIWHFAFSRNPDIVLFYTLSDGYLNMAMLGTHHDYPSDGKNRSAGQRSGTRVRSSIAREPVMNPGWRTLQWSDPSDLLGHPDLPELSAGALRTLLQEIDAELDSAPRFEALHGHPITDASEDDVLMNWIDAAYKANVAVATLLRSKPLSAEAYLEAIRSSQARAYA